MPLDPSPSAMTFGRVRLRPFEPRDVDMIIDLSSDPYVPTIGTLPHNAGADDARGYIDRQRARAASGAGYFYCVVDKDTDDALGTAGLHLAPIAAGRGIVGYSVAPRSRGRGVAGQALTALTTWAWSIAGLHRIELYIEPWNLASIRTAEKAQYAREGLLRSHQEIAGHRVDMLLYAAIRPDPMIGS